MPTENSLKKIEAYVKKYCERTGTYTHGLVKDESST